MSEQQLEGLVVRARAGDVAAFTDLVRRYQNTAYAYAYALLRDPHLAEDAAQEAFVAAHAGLGRLDEAAKFPAWLRGITHHQCHRILRRRHFGDVGLDGALDVPGRDEGPERQAERREARQQVLDAVGALAPLERQVVALFYFDGQAQQEIARFLGLPVTTVNNRLHAARLKLRERMVDQMKKAFDENALPRDFAERVGRIVQVRGPVVDVEFGPGELPGILEALEVGDADGQRVVTVEVVHRPEGALVRAVTAAPTTAVRRGMRVAGRGRAAPAPLGDQALGRAVQVLRRRPAAGGELLETGIKAIDLLCPFVRGGAVGIFGGARVGKLVLVEELMRRIGAAGSDVSLFTLVQPGDVETVRGCPIPEPTAEGTVQTFYVPSEGASDPTYAARQVSLDAAIYLARDLVLLGLYPAVDPVLAASRALDPGVAGPEHHAVAGRARQLLWDARAFQGPDVDLTRLPQEDQVHVGRARKLQRFLTQPLFVAEPYTKLPGEAVGRADTLSGCAAILDGRHDDLPEEAFYMVGPIEGALAKARAA